MNKLEIKNEITNIANEEISEQIDLWPRIQSEIQQSEYKSPSRLYKFWKPAFAFCVFFLFTAASYFVYKSLNQDVSIPPQWVTEMNQTEQMHDLIVTLDWAYLDAARASIGILTTYPSDGEFSYQLKEAHLYTGDGQELPAMIKGSGGGGGGNAQDVERQTGTHLNFDSSSIDVSSKSVSLTLELSYEALSQIHQQTTGLNDSQNTQEQTAYQFSFDFSLPYFEAVEGKTVENRVALNDFWFEIDQISITPSITRFNLCYEQPDTNSNWVPLVFVDSSYMESVPMQEQQPDVLTDGKMGYRAHLESAPATNENITCVKMFALAPYDGESDLTITVDSITIDATSFTDEYIAAEKAYFAEQGFQLEVKRYDFGQEMSGSLIVKVISEDQFVGVQVLDYPDGINETQAQIYVSSRIFKQRINGPWKFSIKTH